MANIYREMGMEIKLTEIHSFQLDEFLKNVGNACNVVSSNDDGFFLQSENVRFGGYFSVNVRVHMCNLHYYICN